MSENKRVRKSRPVNLDNRASKRAAAAQQAQARADRAFATAYGVFHACRLRLWEALAALVAEGRWRPVFDTEAEGSASARCENTAFWGGFRFQPERTPSGKAAGARNLGDYPAELQTRTGGWRDALSAEARALADRAHGYLCYVALEDSRTPGTSTAFLATRNGAPVFAGLWAGLAPSPDVLPLPALPPSNNADLVGRIYKRMDDWRAQVAQVDPSRLPVSYPPGWCPAKPEGEPGEAQHIPGRGELDPASGVLRLAPTYSGGPVTHTSTNPLTCYLAARTVFWAQVSRLETMFLGRYVSRTLGDGPTKGRTQPDKKSLAAFRTHTDMGAEDVVSREDFAQELCPYTYRAMESWHPARGCFSTYYEFKVKHALRNLRAQNLPRCDSFAQEQDYMSGAADPYSQKGASWRRAFQHTDAPPGVGDALIAGLTTHPDGPDMVALRERLADPQTRPAQRKVIAEHLGHMLADQAPGVTTLQPRAGVVIRRKAAA